MSQETTAIPSAPDGAHKIEGQSPKATNVAKIALVLSVLAFGVSLLSLLQQREGINLQRNENIVITDIIYTKDAEHYINQFQVRVRNDSQFPVQIESAVLEWRWGIALVQIPLSAAGESKCILRGQGALYRFEPATYDTLRRFSDVSGSTFSIIARSSSGRVFSTSGTKYDEILRKELRFFPRLPQ